MSPSAFSVGWEAGAGAQIEVFSPGSGTAAEAYRLRYTAPFRATIRPPLEELTLGSQELDPIRDRLNGLVQTIQGRNAATATPVTVDESVLDEAKLVGSQLLDLIVPTDVQADIRTPHLFLEVGVDEALLGYPWELMHDGDEFLCLKHLVGRFVNLTKPAIPPRQRPDALAPGALSILLISVPYAQPRPSGANYDPLPGAEAETAAIVNALAPLQGMVTIHLLNGPKATYDAVYKAIKGGRYHIVHFNGHAYFDSDRPHLSSLVLFDRDLSTGPIINFFGARPPVLFVMNACETAASQGTGLTWRGKYDIFGLARAFLETGAYLVGSRWKVGDTAAASFATAFYSSLVQGQALGRATRAARFACRSASPTADLSWASYLLYGDPRLRFSPC